ncbi:hypothetical protein AVEN_192705-1, partial [Araneus ventricosus]
SHLTITFKCIPCAKPATFTKIFVETYSLHKGSKIYQMMISVKRASTPNEVEKKISETSYHDFRRSPYAELELEDDVISNRAGYTQYEAMAEKCLLFEDYVVIDKMGVGGKGIDGSSTKVKSDLSSLRPTKGAAEQHSFRVYLQIQQWLINQLPPDQWGWAQRRRWILIPSDNK